jgi:2-keto-4-pentenoate hydratase
MNVSRGLQQMTDLVTSTAERIVREHAERRLFQSLPSEVQGDLDFAYRVQDAVLERWSGPFGEIAGWKVGLTTARMQQLCGVSQPIAGAILASRLHRSPASVDAAGYVRFGLEAELSFRVAATPPDDPGLGAADMRAFLDLACASYELIEDRAADYGRLNAASMIADNSWNAGIVMGEPIELAQLADTVGVRGRLSLNGVEIDRGSSEDVGGDPLAITAWLARALRSRGRALQPGQWIMTGSLVPTRFPKPGESYGFELDGLPPVALSVR